METEAPSASRVEDDLENDALGPMDLHEDGRKCPLMLSNADSRGDEHSFFEFMDHLERPTRLSLKEDTPNPRKRKGDNNGRSSLAKRDFATVFLKPSLERQLERRRIQAGKIAFESSWRRDQLDFLRLEHEFKVRLLRIEEKKAESLRVLENAKFKFAKDSEERLRVLENDKLKFAKDSEVPLRVMEMIKIGIETKTPPEVLKSYLKLFKEHLKK